MHALAILLAIPLLGGLLLWALGERESAPEANAAFSFATFVAAAWVTADVVSTGPIRIYEDQFFLDSLNVFLVSLTVDPEVDTPTRLKEYAKKFNAGRGWIFLTGKKENLDWALYKLGQYVQDKNAHKTIVIIGNEASGLWKKAFGLASADDLIKLVEEVMNDKPQKGTEGHQNEF